MAPPPVCTGNGAGCPSLDSQDAIALTPNGKFLFAVNAGSNTVSSFKVTRHGVALVNQVSSGGAFPDSLTVHGNLVYVLNANSLNIQGIDVQFEWGAERDQRRVATAQPQRDDSGRAARHQLRQHR